MTDMLLKRRDAWSVVNNFTTGTHHWVTPIHAKCCCKVRIRNQDYSCFARTRNFSSLWQSDIDQLRAISSIGMTYGVTDKNYNNVWQGSQISQQDGLQTTHQDYSCKNLVSQCPVGPPTPHSLWPQFDSWMPLLKKRLSGILVPNQDQARMRDWLSLLKI